MTTETATPETRPFEAEVSQVLDLMIHSLYTHREIFLRELISNASDALDKVRFHSLTSPELLADGDSDLHVLLEPDEEEGTLTIADNGLGMNREDLISSLGTIARSGTKRFMEGLKEAKGANAPELIGQFGVGFYSAFMVADRVVVETRKAGEESGWRWSSDGKSDFTIEEIEKPTRGTRIVLHLKEAQEGEEDPPSSFMSEWRLRDVVKRYSDFVEYPIRMDVERTEPKKDDEGKDIEGETVTTVETETLNSTRPLWSRDKSEIKEEEYAEFYKHLSRDWQDPLDTIHFKAEGTQEYTALVYVPSQRPFDLFDPKSQKARVSLYVKRVFITDECEELLPQYLRFVRGVVDSADLPLNVSRETLQENRILAQIQKRLVTKVLESLLHMSKTERESYEKFWDAFGEVLKEGIATDMDSEGRVAKLLLFASTRGEERTTLAEAVERMPEGQETLWVATGASRAAMEGSPHLEFFRERGYEVLFATDPIDEWVFERLTEFDGKKICRVSQGTAELESDDDKKAREAAQEENEGLLESLKTLLGEHVEEVRLTKHLTGSPAVLVAGKNGPTSQMQRIMERAGQPAPKAKYILELNPDHPLFERMTVAYGEDTQGAKVGQYAELLLGQALLFEGAELPDPARFAKCMNELLAP